MCEVAFLRPPALNLAVSHLTLTDDRLANSTQHSFTIGRFCVSVGRRGGATEVRGRTDETLRAT
eukprot:3120678-Pleurochrysis_carterae.AAC.1